MAASRNRLGFCGRLGQSYNLNGKDANSQRQVIWIVKSRVGPSRGHARLFYLGDRTDKLRTRGIWTVNTIEGSPNPKPMNPGTLWAYITTILIRTSIQAHEALWDDVGYLGLISL